MYFKIVMCIEISERCCLLRLEAWQQRDQDPGGGSGVIQFPSVENKWCNDKSAQWS